VLGDPKGVCKFALYDCDQNAIPPYPSDLAGMPPVGTDYPALQSVGGYGIAFALPGVLSESVDTRERPSGDQKVCEPSNCQQEDLISS
jgi:hypothetical protein